MFTAFFVIWLLHLISSVQSSSLELWSTMWTFTKSFPQYNAWTVSRCYWNHNVFKLVESLLLYSFLYMDIFDMCIWFCNWYVLLLYASEAPFYTLVCLPSFFFQANALFEWLLVHVSFTAIKTVKSEQCYMFTVGILIIYCKPLFIYPFLSLVKILICLSLCVI